MLTTLVKVATPVFAPAAEALVETTATAGLALVTVTVVGTSGVCERKA